MPSEKDLLLAVRSLYADALRPYGRILRKRLAEDAARQGRSDKEMDLGLLRGLCENCACFLLRDEPGGEWCVLLLGEEPRFVDIYSDDDPYPESLWSRFEDHLQQLDSEGTRLPGGRFSCAQRLKDSNLPFLSDCSLGAICHIVQLSLTRRKLLGYRSGEIVPYGRSQTMVKDDAAAQQSFCIGKESTSRPVATWEQVRDYVQQVLSSAEGDGAVPLSNIKRLIRSRFNAELSETALGHAKLSDLLRDERLQDVCLVSLLEAGYFVLPAVRDGTAHAAQAACSTRRSLPQGPRGRDRDSFGKASGDRAGHARTRSDPAVVLASPLPWRLSQESTTLCDQEVEVQNTFVHLQLPKPARSLRRSRSVPASVRCPETAGNMGWDPTPSPEAELPPATFSPRELPQVVRLSDFI